MSVTKIEGVNGDWELDVRDNAPPAQDSIQIKFTPKHKADGCRDIRLSQTVQTEGFNSYGVRIASRQKDVHKPPPADPFVHREDDEYTDEEGNVIVIDHLSCEMDPFYNGNDLHDRSSQGNATKDPPDATEISDSPRYPAKNIKAPVTRIVKSFRTCAICFDTGEILGCISWTAEATAENPGQISISYTEGAATDSFRGALKKFMKEHTRKKEGEQSDRLYCADYGMFGGFVPPGLKNYLVAAVPEAPGEIKQAVMLKSIDLDPQQAGGGASSATVNEALASVIGNPASSALKFTWTSAQTKTVSSIILSPQELSAEIIAPFLDNRPEMMNDFEALKAHKCSSSLMRSFAQTLQKNQTRLFAREIKPVMITIIGNLGQKTAASLTVGMEPPDFLPAVKAACLDAEPSTRTVLDYLRLNMGLDRSAAVSALPSKDFPGG